jgi:hypothetical protein
MTDLVDELFRKVKKDRGVNAPKFYTNYNPGEIQQADLLFLPDDNGYKYTLTVFDLGSRMTDAEPLKDKLSSNIKKGFESIYKRKMLTLPKQIEFDAGTEFKGDAEKYFKDNNVIVKVKKPHRSRQQAMVERRNQFIGTALFKRMTAEELLTDKPSTQWTGDLKDVLKQMNDKEKKRKVVKPSNEYQCKGDACKLLSEGTKVRVALEKPIDIVTGKRLHGGFRDSDIRFEIKPKTIKQVIINPDNPPMYLVSNSAGGTDHTQAYTKNQLLPVKSDEVGPKESQIRPISTKMGQKTYNVEKLLERRTLNRSIYFLVKWIGFKEPTLEPRTTLVKDVKDMVLQFERDLKNKNKSKV